LLGAPSSAGDEPVRVYTNADLEELPAPAPAAAASEGVEDELGWQFVAQFLEREHARIESERAAELERRRLELEQQALVPEGRWEYGLAGVPWFDRSFECGDERRHLHARPGVLGRPIRPLHAGPTLAELHWQRAIGRSGADAFPGNARARSPQPAHRSGRPALQPQKRN
jgi:hypothetical protein